MKRTRQGPIFIPLSTSQTVCGFAQARASYRDRSHWHPALWKLRSKSQPRDRVYRECKDADRGSGGTENKPSLEGLDPYGHGIYGKDFSIERAEGRTCNVASPSEDIDTTPLDAFYLHSNANHRLILVPVLTRSCARMHIKPLRSVRALRKSTSDSLSRPVLCALHPRFPGPVERRPSQLGEPRSPARRCHWLKPVSDRENTP